MGKMLFTAICTTRCVHTVKVFFFLESIHVHVHVHVCEVIKSNNCAAGQCTS